MRSPRKPTLPMEVDHANRKTALPCVDAYRRGRLWIIPCVVFGSGGRDVAWLLRSGGD
jgi:hypothetical protein